MTSMRMRAGPRWTSCERFFYGEPEGECDGQEGGPKGRDVIISDLIYELYPLALDCGISPCDFWEYSFGEIRDLMDSYARNERRRVRDEIAARYELADLIGMYIQIPYDTDNTIRIPRVWDTYPSLFENERIAFEGRQKAEALEQARISRREYAERYNEMRRKRGLH